MKQAIILAGFLLSLLHAAAEHQPPRDGGGGGESIVLTTLGRSHYDFDIFTLPTRSPPSDSLEFQITDGRSVNFNGHFPSPSSSLLSLSNQTLIQTKHAEEEEGDGSVLHLIYVTERNGSSNIFYDVVRADSSKSEKRRSLLEESDRIQVGLLAGANYGSGKSVISMKDRPVLSGEYLIYVSTHEDPGVPRASWTAVYSTQLGTGLTRRLTPPEMADFSPAVSPSGDWTAVASYGEKGWSGEVEELSTDIYIFLTRDGTHRVKVVEHGGWPSWADESTLYFHKRSEEDGWISVYRAVIQKTGPVSAESVTVQRVTPPGLHAFTPAASPGNHDFIAVATRRPGSDYRHIELFDLRKNEFVELTRSVSPTSHYFNPFLSPDSARVGYHSCRGDGNRRQKSPQLFLENIQTPTPNLSLFIIDGSFPSFSPDGDRVAYVNLPGLFVAGPDGSNRREVYQGMAFSTSWDPIRPGVVYTSTGPTFASASSEVDVIEIDVDAADQSRSVRKLTTNGENNAFPSPSPDGRWIVFRSGRSGHKNLYIMDAENGESGGIRRLTSGEWTDTMCDWSPDGEFIAFASDRDSPGSGSFDLYLIHPNGTGLRKLIQSGRSGRTNHPSFSPDGKTIVFTSDYGGISAEPISNPHHYQPYGEIFTVKLDGTELRRLTHNSYEDGTPTWAPRYIRADDVAWPKINGPACSFEDCHWLNKMPNRIDMGRGPKISC